MRRRMPAGGNPAEKRLRKRIKPRRVAKTPRPRSPTVAELTKQLSEALEQQVATSDVLGIIAKSPQSVQPVFDAIVANAARLCDAAFSAVAKFDGELLHLVAVNKMSPEETAAYHTVFPRRPNRTFIMGRAFVDGRPVHVEDIEADPDYDPHTLSVIKAAAPYRTYLGIPILRDGVPIGAIGCGRREVKPFTEAQIELVKSFAAQAVIAIENTRLLNELRQRTDDLSEALEQQTATSKVLKVISSSQGKLEPVFDAMLENAVRICEAKFGVMHLFEGDTRYTVATLNAPPALAEEFRQAGRRRPSPSGILVKLLKSKQTIHVHDMQVSSPSSPPARLAGARTQIAVPMLKDGQVVGALIIYRQEVRPFTDKQIELVQNFAAQAVIAVENTRLLNELRESLSQQTATADLLKVISRSTFDLQTVLDTLVESAGRLCQAGSVALRIAKDGLYHHAASYGLPPEHTARAVREPIRPDQATVGQVLSAGKSVGPINRTAPDEPSRPGL
jgi:two-component system, NtrC family, sensor kinase